MSIQPSSKMGEFHGGNLDWAEEAFGRPAAGWVDLSTGINPWSYPFMPPNPEAWQRLPTDAEITALETVAAQRYGLSAQGAIVSASGSQSLIQLLPRLRERSKVAVLSPTYGEHRAAWHAAGHSVVEVEDETGIDKDVSVVVLTNPNNPDGRIVSRERLRVLRETLSARGGWLVADEAFADIAPNASVTDLCGSDGLIVLRSFGKFYGLAGLRLGFALTTPPLARAICEALGPWAVSGPAISIACQALVDDGWHLETRERLTIASQRLDVILAQAGLMVSGGTPLFRLAVSADAQTIFQRLGRAGILVRHFPQYRSWLRFGIPAREEDFERVRQALVLTID
jgi:cobalamin biosynthetic protein CobC